MTNYNVNVNFGGAFAQINNADDLKGVAQAIINQLQTAYKARLAELLGSTDKQPKAISVAVSATNMGTTKKATTTKATEKKEAKKVKEEVKQVLIASLSKADIKAMGVKFVQYSEKCVALSGNTKAIKEDIKKLAGGHWNHARQCWFLKNDEGHKLAKTMGLKVAKVA